MHVPQEGATLLQASPAYKDISISERTSPLPLTDLDGNSIAALPEDGLEEQIHARVTSPEPLNINGLYRHNRRSKLILGDESDAGDLHDSIEEEEEPWSKCVNSFKEHDKAMVERWKEEIDTLLVFAGLFSAVLTAFVIESYKLLQPDPAQMSATLLQQISAQLGSSTSTSNAPPPITQATTFKASPSAVRINTLWFSSLVCSLVSASLGILTKQWLREYLGGTARSPREDARIRQFRSRNFARWHIPEVIAFLPVLLQLALVLFFAGLLDLLWHLHPVVAGVITGLVSVALSFLAFTTVLPALRPDCPYKSPQAMGLIRLKNVFMRGLSWLARYLWKYFGWHELPGPFYMPRAQKRTMLRARLRALMDRKHRDTWKDMEIDVVQAEGSEKLEHQFLTTADATFMKDTFLQTEIRACLRELDEEAALRSLSEILTHRADSVNGGTPQWKRCDTMEEAGRVVMLTDFVLDILNDTNSPRTDYSSIMKTLANLCRAIPFENDPTNTQPLFLRVFNVVAGFLQSKTAQAEAFELLWTIYERSAVVVPSEVILKIVIFAKDSGAHIHIDAQPRKFVQACTMAIDLCNSISFSDTSTHENIRRALPEMLQDLQSHLPSRLRLQRPLCLSMLPCRVHDLHARNAWLPHNTLQKALVDLSLEGRNSERTPETDRQQWDLLVRSSRGRLPPARHRPRRATMMPSDVFAEQMADMTSTT